jgi:hypothetical protein
VFCPKKQARIEERRRYEANAAWRARMAEQELAMQIDAVFDADAAVRLEARRAAQSNHPAAR